LSRETRSASCSFRSAVWFSGPCLLLTPISKRSWTDRENFFGRARSPRRTGRCLFDECVRSAGPANPTVGCEKSRNFSWLALHDCRVRSKYSGEADNRYRRRKTAIIRATPRKSTYRILAGFADFWCILVPMRSGACREASKAGNPHEYRVREGFKVRKGKWVGWDSNPQPTPTSVGAAR